MRYSAVIPDHAPWWSWDQGFDLRVEGEGTAGEARRKCVGQDLEAATERKNAAGGPWFATGLACFGFRHLAPDERTVFLLEVPELGKRMAGGQFLGIASVNAADKRVETVIDQLATEVGEDEI